METINILLNKDDIIRLLKNRYSIEIKPSTISGYGKSSLILLPENGEYHPNVVAEIATYKDLCSQKYAKESIALQRFMFYAHIAVHKDRFLKDAMLCTDKIDAPEIDYDYIAYRTDMTLLNKYFDIKMRNPLLQMTGSNIADWLWKCEEQDAFYVINFEHNEGIYQAEYMMQPYHEIFIKYYKELGEYFNSATYQDIWNKENEEKYDEMKKRVLK